MSLWVSRERYRMVKDRLHDASGYERASSEVQRGKAGPADEPSAAGRRRSQQQAAYWDSWECGAGSVNTNTSTVTST